jgi:hypothetical protein
MIPEPMPSSGCGLAPPPFLTVIVTTDGLTFCAARVIASFASIWGAPLPPAVGSGDSGVADGWVAAAGWPIWLVAIKAPTVTSEPQMAAISATTKSGTMYEDPRD